MASEESKDGAATTSSSVLGEEPDTSRSLAACLRLAREKGYLEKEKSKRKPVVILSEAKRAKLEAKSITIEEKKDDNHHRRYRNVQLQEVREPADFKPDIILEYTDDSGRKLETQKEAFRYLCHKFHGKGPGKNKIDKMLKKQELEAKLKESRHE